MTRPQLGDWYRQGRCVKCEIPIFGEEDIDRTVCNNCETPKGTDHGEETRIEEGPGEEG